MMRSPVGGLIGEPRQRYGEADENFRHADDQTVRDGQIEMPSFVAQAAARPARRSGSVFDAGRS